MKVAVIGLGYVGLPLAVAFKEKKIDVIGFDVNKSKISEYKKGIDVTLEVGNDRLKKSKLNVTSSISDIKEYNIFIVAVPTPITNDNLPDFTPLEKSSELISKVIKKGDIIIYESTVYPGVTENLCGAILEKESGLKCGVDFFLGYSPERINPGDKEHRLENIIKIVSGQNEEVLEAVAELYEIIIEAGVHRASSIKVAESAKVIENAQRDLNIAFMNELSTIFNLMNINTEEVLKASGTKWNFLNFKPGLVGGHCIGVDPYYLAHCARENGYHAKVILSGRKVNDDKAIDVSKEIVSRLSKLDKPLKNCRVGIMGLTFKENCPDTRNSKVFDIIAELKKFNVEIIAHDNIAERVVEDYGLKKNYSYEEMINLDAIVFAVNHDYLKNLDINEVKKKFNVGSNILIDLKWIFKVEDLDGLDYFRL
ncbi:MAG: nucleotide sugar dehydrogenase [Mycoplasmatales bacterium]